MTEKILMPKMGESVMEGTIIKWYKKVGDEVKRDEIIFEISTDKVDTEVPSPVDGILTKIFLNENETAEVNTIVAEVETDKANAVVEKKSEVAEIVVNTAEEATEEISDDDLVDVPMPKMGESVMEGTIIKWHKKVGESVKADEIIFEISTDKVDTEVPSPIDGILAEILVVENETAEVGVVVARISTSGKVHKKQVAREEKRETSNVKREMEDVKRETSNVKREMEDVKRETSNVNLEIKEEKSEINQQSQATSNKFYSPLVLNIAQKEGVPFDELEKIQGTGISGRVTKKDILNYLETRTIKKEVSSQKQVVTNQFPLTNDQLQVTTFPMNNIRKKIMHHMIASRDTSVHVSEVMEVDMTIIYNFIEKNREKFASEGIKLTYMAFISYAVAKALKKFPLMNSSIDGENVVQKNYVNLGIAVAVEPNGLIVPNIKGAENLNVRGLAKAVANLSYNARNKKLSPDDVMDGTFSITNYGVFGALFGTPIINQPEVGILGVGAVKKRAVVVETEYGDQIAIKPMMYLSLSHDHRLVDGMLGGLFLKEVKDILEKFDLNSI